MAANQVEEIGILKSIWRRDEAGTWIVHDMQGIDLKPRDGFGNDFFKIKNEVHLLTQRPGPIFENLLASFGHTEFLIRQSILPVVAWNDGDDEMRCIGTGFLISASGLFLTAAHVLRDPLDEGYTQLTAIGDKAFRTDKSLRMGAFLPANPAMKNAPFPIHPALRNAKWFVLPIQWAVHWGNQVESPLFHQKAEFKLDLDIAVCKLTDNIIGGSYQPLNIGQHDLKIGDKAVAIGYAEMKNIRFKDADDYQPELTVSVGSVKNIFRDNITEKKTPTPGPCFEFDARIPGKMSGSPILVGSGILTKGVVSRSWQGEKHATGCLIAPIMHLPLVDGRSLIDIANNGNEGIARVRGTDI